MLVHLYYLVGFQNRLLVMTRWTLRFITRGRGARVISENPRALADSDGSG
jgi:NADH dehydrogenase